MHANPVGELRRTVIYSKCRTQEELKDYVNTYIINTPIARCGSGSVSVFGVLEPQEIRAPRPVNNYKHARNFLRIWTRSEKPMGHKTLGHPVAH